MQKEQLKNGTRFLDTYGEYKYEVEDGIGILKRKDEITKEWGTPDYSFFTDSENEFEVVEETEEIDIDSIEEVNVTDRGMDTDDCILYYEDKMNELIKAVKQINNKLKEPNCKVGGTE